MRIIDITHPPQSLWIGREGENTFRPVSFECANWFSAYPSATIVAYYQPYGAADPYPLVLVEDGTKRIWHPLLNELVKGDGELQIVLMQGDTVGTSAIIPTKVDRSLISNADHPASETPAWPVKVVQDVTEQADRAEAAVSHYPKILNGVWFVWDATQSKFVSTGISAQGEDGFSPTVTVTAIEGGHRVTITDTDGAHTFDVMDGQGGSGGSETVIVTIDDTTDPMTASMNSTEIKAAVDAAKRVIVRYDGAEIPYLIQADTISVFSTTVNFGTLTSVAILVSANATVDVLSTDLVQSVNGMTGAVTLSASDVGAYVKPSGGIPASDLASAVQDSLGKADTALQQHQSLAGYATETWVEGKGYQTAQDVQTAIAGKADKTPRVAMASTDTSATLNPNTLYVFPEMASLAITLAAPADLSIVNEYHFIFESGATATTTTFPAIPGLDDFAAEANTAYEVSILEGRALVTGWEVTA